MIEKTCDNCIRWFKCRDHSSHYNRETRKYGSCEKFECDENLDGRMAKCGDCGNTNPSQPSLPFFWYRPDKEYDSYYCGCYGWD